MGFSQGRTKCTIKSVYYLLHDILIILDPPGKFLMFTQTSRKDSTPSLYTGVFPSEREHLFRFRFWYFMYGQDDGNLTVYITQRSTSALWNTTSRSVRNWQFQQIEMRIAPSFSVSVCL
jgi:hypothetical protein